MDENKNNGTIEFHLFGLIGTTSQTDMQKIRKIYFFFLNRLHGQFEVLEATTLYCTSYDNRQFKGKFVSRILDKFTRKVKQIWIIGNPDNQPSDKWISTAYYEK